MPSAAASGTVCPGTTGVTVIVDFGSLGGGIAEGCATGAPSTGLIALVKAGFPYVEVSTVPGFVCRIGGLPGPDKQNCSNTPPGNAYWAYFHATRGGDWVFSQMGAGSTKPAQGSVEGWAFQSSTANTRVPPSVAPPAAVQPTAKPTPKPTPKPTTAPTPAPPTPKPTTAGSAELTSAPTSTLAPTPTPTPSALATDAPAPTPADASMGPALAATSSGSGESGDGSGDPAGTLIGMGLIVLVGGGSLVLARRGGAAR